MTESEWLESANPAQMLDHMASRISDRKSCLIAAACIRSFDPGKNDVDQLERVADRDPSDLGWSVDPFAMAYHWACNSDPVGPRDRPACDILRDIIGNPFRPVSIRKVVTAARDMSAAALESGATEEVAWQPPWLTPQVLALADAAYHVRCPGCDQCFDGHILDGCSRVCPNLNGGVLDPERLAILADALEEAGCTSNITCQECSGTGRVYDYMDWQSCSVCWNYRNRCGSGHIPHPILAHLRSPGPHWRGCWVVDLILGKE